MDVNQVNKLSEQSVADADKARELLRRSQAGSGLTERQRQQAKKVSRDFEAMVVGMMLKSMRETVGKDKLTGGGHGEEVYRSLLDQEYATNAVKRGGGLGLAKMIERDIIRQESRRAGQPLIDTRE